MTYKNFSDADKEWAELYLKDLEENKKSPPKGEEMVKCQCRRMNRQEVQPLKFLIGKILLIRGYFRSLYSI